MITRKTTRRQSRAVIDDAKLALLWGSRLRECDLAKLMGHHRNTIRRRATKLGLPPRRELWAEKP